MLHKAEGQTAAGSQQLCSAHKLFGPVNNLYNFVDWIDMQAIILELLAILIFFVANFDLFLYVVRYIV